MSLSYYGGFPGPPDNTGQPDESQDVNLRSNLNPAASNFNRDVTIHRNSNLTDLSYQGPRFNSQPHQSGPYFYDPNYYNQIYQQPFIEQGNVPSYSGINQGASPFYPSNQRTHNQHFNPQQQPPQSFYEQNDNTSSAANKSRRFSRQRTNVNQTSSSGAKMGGVRGEERAPCTSEQQNHPIRFSHQREPTPKREKIHAEKKKSKTQNSSKPRKNEVGKAPPGDSQQLSEDLKGLEINKEKPTKPKKKVTKLPRRDGNQASLLLDQLSDGTYECMVCCDPIKQPHAVWNCQTCYNLFHMGCIKKWARSSAAKLEGSDTGWRCPGCQALTLKVPNTYFCFCGGERDPVWRKGEMPHSCGEVCGKKRKEDKGCPHRCNKLILCHPGPCPHCPAMVNRKCRCKKSSSRVRCSRAEPLVCGEACGKSLNCDVHSCEEVCHAGVCESCVVDVQQTCFCGLNVRTVICGSDDHKVATNFCNNSYSCGGRCGKMLDCGNHSCEQECHLGDCSSCSLLPQVVKHCPCGQTELVELYLNEGSVKREKCTDPIPTCAKVCGKKLPCGGDEEHFCSLPCHLGVCTPCQDGESVLTCRCGKSDKDVRCSEFVLMDSYVCDRRCNKKRKCGRHKCGQTCCIDNEHVCMQICGKKLSCHLHRCDEPCHRGTCHTCYNVCFDELRCHCEEEVIYPPIPCGTRPPECRRECTRVHTCNHTVRHTCHTEEQCPPCVELVKKACNCGKMTRGSIMCHIENVSCGAPCSKTLACGHKCLKICHKGPCLTADERCHQPCSIMRSQCIHPCSNPCHHGEGCPATKCKAMVTLKCSCGLLEKPTICSHAGHDNSAMLSKNEVDIGKFLRPGTNSRALPCSEECSVAERNRRLAAALDIKDPDLSGRSKQVYSEFLLSMAKSDTAFIHMVEQEISNLVESVGSMGINKQVHSFPPMKREKRQAVHELATAFSCKSDSYDVEPNRNVVVMATKGVATQPQPLLSDVIMKDVTTSVGSKLNSEKKPKGRLLSSVRMVSYSSAGKSPPGKPPPTTKPPSLRRVTTGSAPATTTSRLIDLQPASSLSPFAQNFQMRSSVESVAVATDNRSRSFPPPSQGRHTTTPSVTSQSVVVPATKSEDKEVDYFDMTE